MKKIVLKRSMDKNLWRHLKNLAITKLRICIPMALGPKILTWLSLDTSDIVTRPARWLTRYRCCCSSCGLRPPPALHSRAGQCIPLRLDKQIRAAKCQNPVICGNKTMTSLFSFHSPEAHLQSPPLYSRQASPLFYC